MFLRFIFALVLLTSSITVHAQQRFSLQLTGSYTELSGQPDIDALITPLVPEEPFNFFDPVFLPGEPVRVGGEVPFDSEDLSWELVGAWALLPNLQLIGGYTDFGSFESERFFGGAIPADLVVGVPTLPPISRPLPPISSPPAVAFRAAPPRADLDIDAWLYGVRGTHQLNDRFRIFGRLGGLRASFDVSYDASGLGFELLDPSDENGWFWGVGVQYELLPRLLLGVGYTQYDVSLEKLDSYQLSIEALVF